MPTGLPCLLTAVRPRLGLRWQTPRRRIDSHRAVRLALQGEVGQLAASEAVDFAIADENDCWRSPVLYTEPAPPGRDIFSGLQPSIRSAVAGRLSQRIAESASLSDSDFANPDGSATRAGDALVDFRSQLCDSRWNATCRPSS